MFALIVGARMKAIFDFATMIGWEARRFHHMKRPKPLADYLKPSLSPEQLRDEDAKRVRLAFERRIKKQQKEAGDGSR